MMSSLSVLREAAIARLQTVSDNPALELAWLIEAVLGLSPSKQKWFDEPLSDKQVAAIEGLLARRVAGEPLAYIVGHQPFYDLDLQVTPATLIPRPETEHLLEEALTRLPKGQTLRIADLGTGSGALAIALAKHRPQTCVAAVDVSWAALQIAQDNAQRYGLNNVIWIQGDWLRGFSPESLHMIVSNPPYIDGQDPHLSALRFEPRSALVAAQQGFADLFVIISQAETVLRAGGWLLLEHGYQQGKVLRDFAEMRGVWQEITTRRDYAGHERVTVMRLRV